MTANTPADISAAPKLQKTFAMSGRTSKTSILERAGSDVRVRTLSEDEYGFATGSSQKESSRRQIRAIDEREHELDDEARAKHQAAKEIIEDDRAFRELHNRTKRQAFMDFHADSGQDERERHEQMRVTAWWRNMSERYSDWRAEKLDKATEWGERFRQQKSRLKAMLGWEIKEAPDNDNWSYEEVTPDTTISAGQLDNDEAIEPSSSPDEPATPDEPDLER